MRGPDGPQEAVARALDALGTGAYLTDEQGFIVAVNARGEELLARPASDLVGQDAHDLLHRTSCGELASGHPLGIVCHTRRLLWSTPWRPERTLATAAIGDPRTLALVGLINLNRLAGATAHGTTWLVEDDTLQHPTRTEDRP
ncbi:PAS domain-containing protein [Streptomyces sp. NPDC057611]|uniref:PAS domain-containing protein n=1 Tax=Streptomyces sp. NPDC057611 TaxID=3346182 RepID=UPI0036CE2BBB